MKKNRVNNFPVCAVDNSANFGVKLLSQDC